MYSSWCIYAYVCRRYLYSEGDKVRLSDHVYLFSSHLRMYLNAETLSLNWADHMNEVDMSTHTTSWTLKLYTQVNAVQHLTGGDIVRLYHFECEGYLVAEGQSQGRDQTGVAAGAMASSVTLQVRATGLCATPRALVLPMPSSGHPS